MSLNFNAFEIGRRALNVQQYGITVTGQNIANVNTPGYSRQHLVLAESVPQNLGRLQIGAGVEIKSVQEFRDRFIEARRQSETGIAGRLTARRDVLATVETSLQGTETGGLANSLNAFFGAFRDLDANPNSVPLRAIVAQRGAALASAFQTTRGRLDNIRIDTDEQLRLTVDSVNSLSEKIAELNGQIAVAENINANASALKDQRTELVNQLSELTGARTTVNGDGTYNLTIGEGRPLVSGTNAHQLVASTTPPLGLSVLTLDGQPAVFDEGKIRGLQEAIDETTAQIDDLDGLAAQVVDRVNTLHTSGTDADGNAGVPLFDNSVPVDAKNIKINAAVTANPRLVVASAVAPPSQSGTVAGQIANLLTDQTTVVGSRTGSFSSIFGSMLADAGAQVAQADNDLQTQSFIISQISAQRDAVSGVSLDEEAINLLQYQRAFEAAARFLKVADEMTQTILSLAQ